MRPNGGFEELLLGGIPAIRQALKSRNVGAGEFCQWIIERVERLDPSFRSMIRLNERLLDEARQVDRGLITGDLAGVPLTVKDLLTTRDMPTTAGSRVPHEYRERFRDAPVVAALRRAGALIVGKANLHEFAFGVSSENEHFGVVRNPWDPKRIAGGSSGGSAVSIMAGFCAGSIGTDTRGSVRIPCSCCGVTGLKPTLGRFSTRGVVPLSWSLDHVGPMATSALDLDLIARSAVGRGWPAGSRTKNGNFRIGVVPRFFENTAAEVKEAVLRAVAVLAQEGCRISEVEVDDLQPVLDASDVISRAEAFTFHRAMLKESGTLYGGRVRERLSSGAGLSAADLVLALRVRKEFCKKLTKLFRGVDFLLGPTLPLVAPVIGTLEVDCGVRESLVACFVRLTAPYNMAGVPALSLPCGFSSEGLPIGVQIAARRWAEADLIEVGALFQRATDWHLQRPRLEA